MSIATSAPLPTLLLAAVTAITVAGCGVNIEFGDDDTERRTVTETVAVADLRELHVSTDNGAVEISGDATDEITVRAVLRERSAGDAEFEIVEDGDRLVVTGECDGRWWHGCSVGFEVSVPPDFDVDVTTDNGRIDVERIDGSLDVETDNGAIEAARLGSATVDARTDNGRIVLSFDDAPKTVDATTDNGAIAIRVPDDGATYDVVADSDNGAVDVDVATDTEADRRIVAESDNGAIDVEPLQR